MSSTKEITESLGCEVIFATVKALVDYVGGKKVTVYSAGNQPISCSQFGEHGGTEMKRHNLAVERLSKAREEYSKERQQRLDFLNKKIREQKHAEQTF